MRIAIVCTYYPFPPSVGGVETIVRNVAVELAKRGHEVHIITSNLDVTTQRTVTVLGVEEREGVIIYKLKPSKLRIGYARTLHGLKETLRKVRPDIVHAHNLHPHLFQLAKWKSELGYKLIAELHYPAINLDFLIQKLLMKPAMFALRKVSKNTDLFIAHTRLEKSWLEKHGIESSKINTIFTPHISKSLTEYPITKKDNNTILFLSRIVPKKGVHVLIEAFSYIINKVRNVRLLIAGQEDPIYVQKLRELVAKFRLGGFVHFLGSVSEEEKVKLLSSATLFCLPTLADYHPVALLEAQALGTPVVATNVGAISEVVVNGKTGILVEPGNVKQLAEALEMLLTDEEIRGRMSVSAREWAKNFTLEKVVDKLEAVYKNVLTYAM